MRDRFVILIKPATFVFGVLGMLPHALFTAKSDLHPFQNVFDYLLLVSFAGQT